MWVRLCSGTILGWCWPRLRSRGSSFERLQFRRPIILEVSLLARLGNVRLGQDTYWN
jgi:hypothetical protein